jgi:ferritin-like metal-binding protein YciE
MSVTSLHELLEHELKDLYSAETQIAEALPKMARKASSADLKKAFEMHLEETRGHIARLEKIGDMLGTSLKGETCEGAKGLIKEGQKVMEEVEDKKVLDAALIGAAQRVEHYEMAAYGTARNFAKRLGHMDVAKLLQETLDEEKEADAKLNEIATTEVNEKAMQS